MKQLERLPVHLIRTQRVVHVVLCGGLDEEPAECFDRELAAVVADPPEVVVLNLRQVRSMCPRTIEVLGHWRDSTTALGIGILVTDCSDAAADAIRGAGLADALGLDDDTRFLRPMAAGTGGGGGGVGGRPEPRA